jgi:ubiquinone biosynthesis monooxygenase Coq7
MSKWAADRELRVNQAGEYGAKRIYEGQLSVLKKHKDIGEMLAQELEHLEYFNSQLRQRKIRPTLLQPFWHVGGFLLGKVTAMMGEKAAMACTVAVEEVIGQHYQAQLEALQDVPSEPELKMRIKQFCDEELEHHDHGLASGAEQAHGYSVLKFAISNITRLAIALSKRI